MISLHSFVGYQVPMLDMISVHIQVLNPYERVLPTKKVYFSLRGGAATLYNGYLPQPHHPPLFGQRTKFSYPVAVGQGRICSGSA